MDAHVYDVVGVGFGPANLALAIAVGEHNRRVTAAERLSCVFLEKQEQFGWHTGMLIDGARMQISFIKDLVTLRNPTSDFSFLAFLAAQDRLVDFTNHQSLFPSRAEFHQYLTWAAGRVECDVHYGRRVVDMRPVQRDGEVIALDIASVCVATGEETLLRARNVIVATGLAPSLPPVGAESDRIIHNEQLMHRLETEPMRSAKRFMVVGAGQSAAETVEHLHRRSLDTEVYTVFSRFGYSPADDSPFANGIFDPASVPAFYHASTEVKEMLLDYHSNTNYSVVDRDLIHDLYSTVYEEKVTGQRRLQVLNTSKITDIQPRSNEVEVRVLHLPSGQAQFLDVDVLVYATGYRPADPLLALGTAAELCKCDSENRPRIELDYRVVTTANVRCGIYVQGPTEHSHGLASTLLSNAAVRAGDVLRSVLAGSR